MFFADFYIADVQWDGERKQAVQFLVQYNAGSQLGEPFWVERQAIIGMLKDKYIFQVIPEGDLSRLSMNGIVCLVMIDGQEYIRTDRQAVPSDELKGVKKLE